MSSDEIIVDTADAPDTGMQAQAAPLTPGPLNAPVNEFSVDSPDTPDRGTQLAAGGANPPGQTVHPRYSVAWDSDYQFVIGANGPLRFVVSRYDGQNVALPSLATVVITLPDGTVLATTPDTEAVGAAFQQVLACDYLFTTRGLYTIKLLATVGNEIVGAVVPVICNQ